MNQALQNRLNQITDKVLTQEFLTSQGLGNELGFWIFDYAPEDELQVRQNITLIEQSISKRNSALRVVNINLLTAIKAYLDQRNHTEKAFQMQIKKGDASLLKALEGPMHVDKFSPFLMEHYQLDSYQLILISGVGSAWPLLRAHNLLNKLHALLGHKPLVLFYPGNYSGQDLSLFNKLTSNNYYRAFKLIPQDVKDNL